MANFEMEYVQCPVCKTEQTMKIYSEVDTTENSKLREKLLLNKLMEYKCKICGYTDQNYYPFLYTDLNDKILIWHIPTESDKQLSEITSEINKENELADKESRDFVFRAVSDYNDLKEKIIIRNAGLDDRVIEVIKLIYESQLENIGGDKVKDKRPIKAYFNQENDGNTWFFDFIFQGDEEPIAFVLEKETYEKLLCESKDAIYKLEKKHDKKGFLVVDRGYAQRALSAMMKSKK